MKAKFLALAALVLGLASCQTDTVNGVKVDANGEAPVTIQVGLPEEATRAAGNNSGVGAIGNIDLDNDWDIRYILEVYDAAGNLAKERMVNRETVSTSTSFTLRLVPGRDYKFVVWADFIPQSQVGNGDYHYNTSSLANVALSDDSSQHPMDESRDAYTEALVVDSFDSKSNISMTLTRPFAKLRVVTTDMNELYSNLTGVTVTYTTDLYSTFNALTQTAEDVCSVQKVVTYDDNTIYYAGEPTDDGKMTLFADYLFGAADNKVHFTMDVDDETDFTIPQIAFNTDIPVERNHLTTIMGPILTDPNNITIEINEAFTNGNEWNPDKDDYDIELWDGTTKTEVQPTPNVETGELEYVVSSASQLAWLADLVNNPTTRATATELNIVLEANIDLNNKPWTAIGTEENYFTGTFDGNGHSIKNLALVESEAKEGKAFVGFFGYAKNATIKNVTFENVYINIPCLDIDHSQGHIGAVAGSLEGTSTIENVTVKGDITVYATQTANGASRVAVVAGGNSYGNVTMKNVHVIANEGSSLIANNNTGALAGQLQGKMVFENCSSNINVTANKFFAGGLVGIAAGDSTFTNCHTAGDITITAGREGKAHDHYRVGGIAGGWADGAKNVCTLTDCSYTGQLSGTNADGSVAEVFDYAGYVGRGYTLNGCQGSKVVIDDVEYVQAYNTAAEAGIYYVNGELVISTASAFKLFANKVNGGETFAGKTVKLGADIDLNNEEWTPIGSAYVDHGFMGNFDGNGYTIKNLTIKNILPDSDGYVYAGLFGVTEGTDKDNQNYIKNLTIENVDIDLHGGIVAAAIAYPYYTAIENVTVKGNVSIKGGHYTAGVLAYTRRCVDAKNISIVGNEASVVEGAQTVGGVISDIQTNGGLVANYSNFVASGLTIKGTKSVGGISGIISQQTLYGATVKNVTIDCDDVRKGKIAGSVGEPAVINNVVVENVAGAGNFVGATYDAGKSSKVTVNDVVYEYNPDGTISFDGKTVVSTADSLVAALEAGKDVFFLNDIKIEPANMSNAYGTTGINVKNGQTIDGNGYTLNIKGAGGTWDSGINTTGGIIKNLTVTGSFRGIFINHTSDYSEKVVLENVTIGGNGTVYTISCDQGLYQGIEATNCTFNGWTSFAKTAGEAKFTNCYFGEGSGYKYCRPYSNTEFEGCTFCPGYAVDQTRATVTFTDCTWE